MKKRKYRERCSKDHKDEDVLNIIKNKHSILVSLNERYKDYYAENIQPRRGIPLIKYKYLINIRRR